LLEQEIKDELGEDVVINTHIEPADINTIVGQKVTPAEISQIESIFTAIKKNWPLIKNIHNIQIKKLDNKYFITIHCLFQKATSLEDAHNMSSKIEYLAKDKLVDIKRVVVHSEPDET
jgi:divalent metal cation (Fe/Co/Zn/Cd) transporter